MESTRGSGAGKKKNRKSSLRGSARNEERLLKHVSLCRDCLLRQGITARVSADEIDGNSENCEICRGLILKLPSVAKQVRKKLGDYEFDTFLVGTSVPQEVLDREDEIRSRFKIRGLEGIKTQISRRIGGEISSMTGKKVDYSKPDVTLLVSLADGSIAISPRSIWLSLRYRKSKRGLAQRSSVCKVCSGLGCAQCNYRGSNRESIQSVVEEFLSQKFRAEGCAFIWIGSEDEKSLVNGEGRPFYVEVQKPQKRTIRSITRKKTIDLDGLSLSAIEAMNSRPVTVPQFRIRCVAYLIRDGGAKGAESSEPPIALREIESKFENAYVQVRISRKDKVVTKKVHSILATRAEPESPHAYRLTIDCDGGIPIRRLVLGGDDSVSPNLSSYVGGLILDPEAPFDIEEVSLVESKPEPRMGTRRVGSRRRKRYARGPETNLPREETESLEELA